MAVVRGTNAGFVTTAPVADPSGDGDTTIDDRKRAVKDTTPSGVTKITEIGWWCNTTTEDVNYEVGIYSHDVGNDRPSVIIGVNRTNAKGTGAGWKVATGLNITISPSTIYWIAIQCDDTAPNATEVDFGGAAGERYSWGSPFSTLDDPWASSNEVDDFLLAIYAVAGAPPTPVDPEQHPEMGGGTILHDFKRFPELTNAQMNEFEYMSPHQQITEDFEATVVKVTDGDTIRVRANFRDFDFPIRLSDIAAPEPKEKGGREGRDWLAERILGEKVNILINVANRISKWGRILGTVIHKGTNMNEQIVEEGFAVPWEERIREW